MICTIREQHLLLAVPACEVNFINLKALYETTQLLQEDLR